VSARVLSGKEVAAGLVERLRKTTESLPYRLSLVFIRAGDDPASASYVRSKARLASKAGIDSRTIVLQPGVTQQELLDLIGQLNADEQVDGILLQLPLYGHLDSRPLLEAISPAKDVDGLHPVNVGRLWSGEDGLFPATPVGLIEILDHFDIPISGKRVVIVGRSNLVGKPAAGLFLRRDATVTVAHSRTVGLADVTREADILVAAVGRAGFIEPHMVKPGATVLDVGQSSSGEGGLRGDVSPEVAAVAGAVTPTPGGTGPMTVASVIANTVKAGVARRG